MLPNQCQCGGSGPCTCQPGPPCPPSPGAWGNRLQQCWSEIQQFRCFIKEVLGDITRTGPIIGDVTGKPAQPGQVGEFVSNAVAGSFTAALQTQTISAIILQPGDWEVQAEVLFANAAAPLAITGALLLLNPVPTGLASNMFTIDARPQTSPALGTVVPADANGWFQLISPEVQAVVSVPTLLAFSVTTNLNGTGTSGTFNFITRARRAR
jgi:hypothetical protein